VAIKPLARTLADAAFAVITPLLFLAWLARPRASTIYVTWSPFSISANTLPGQLPQFFEELLAYYRGTFAAAILTLVVAALVRRAADRRLTQRPALIWFVPTLVAGLEAIRHFSAAGTRHSFTDPPTIDEVRLEWAVAGIASLAAVSVCIVIGIAAVRISRSQRKIPAFPFAVALSVAALWCALLRIAFGP
jgi:hypothetical protein